MTREPRSLSDVTDMVKDIVEAAVTPLRAENKRLREALASLDERLRALEQKVSPPEDRRTS